MAIARRKTPPPARAPRADGHATRLHMLETAGRVFAEQGYAGATSKAICERAGTNLAAVNYHFGSRDALYQAVLAEAHRRFVSLEELAGLAGAAGDPAARLRQLLAHLIGTPERAGAPWIFRLLLREIITPSPLMPDFIERTVLPKARFVLALIGELMALPPSHPAVQRSLLCVVFPCVALAMIPQAGKDRILPRLHARTPPLLDDIMRFVLAGLAANAAAYRGAAGPADGRPTPPRGPAADRHTRPR